MPTITLCIIARDEEEFLPGCLASVRGVVSQIVLVDTGSTDRTVEIAREAGAVVVDHPWEDDFAAARNAALPAATGDWVLVLDADERLAPGAGAALRAALRRPSFVLGLLPLHDATRLDATPAEICSGSARRGERVLLPRLIRRLPDLAWKSRLHENIGEWLVRHGRRATLIEADILHFGAVPEVRAARGKAARNLRLLELQCATEPEQVHAWAYLAAERERAGDLAGARAAEEQGWTMLMAAISRGEHPATIPLVGRRGQSMLANGDLEGLVAMITQARGWGSDHPNLCWLAGNALAGLGRDGSHELRRGLFWTAPCADEIFEGVRGWRSRMVLAGLLLETQPVEALEHAEAAFAETRSAAGQLMCVEALIALGRLEPALARVEPLLTEDLPDAWALAALAARGLGDIESASLFAGRVAGLTTPRRLRALDRLRAELGFRSGLPTPAVGPWGTLGALVHGRVLAGPSPVPGELLDEAVGLLAERSDELGIGALLTRRAEDVIPGAPARVLQGLREAGLDWTEEAEDFIFIGGAGRSGTTLFRAMLDAHRSLWCGPERELIPVFAETHARWARSLGPDLDAAGVDRAALDRAAHAWIVEFLRAGAPEGKRIAEKTPHNLLHAAWLGRLFPHARFLHVLRDGRAVAESLVRQRWIDPETGALLPYCKDLPAAASYWAAVVSESRRQCAGMPRRYLEVRYEQLVTRPRETMAAVLAFLGEPWDEAVLHHEVAGVALSSRESSTAAVGSARSSATVEAWRERLSAADIASIEHAAGAVLRAAGY